jgi:polyisoprenoid-binding protein YceI
MRRGLGVVLFCFLATGSASADDGPCIIPGRGHFHIHTGTSGLFGAFGHDHLIEAQKVQGCAVMDAKDFARSSIKLVFTTADIQALDPKESTKDRAKVQETMETEVLQVSKHPQIVFQSTDIEKGSGPDALRVRGNLTIRGATHPIIVPVTLTRLADGTYRATGAYRFRQTDFGITPIKLGGGTVKVKDEVSTEFELFLK